MTTLTGIEARIADCRTYNFGMRAADQLAHDDAPKLAAALRAIEALHETSFYDQWGRDSSTPQGRGGWCATCGRFDGEGCRTINSVRKALS